MSEYISRRSFLQIAGVGALSVGLSACGGSSGGSGNGGGSGSGTSGDSSGDSYTVPSGGVTIDEAHFPDASLRAYVYNYYDTDKDGVLSKSEIEAVGSVYIDSDVYDTTGIGYFKNIRNLSIGGWLNPANGITNIDFSPYTRLESVDIHSRSITHLDFSHNPNLEYLEITTGINSGSDPREYTGSLVSLNINGCSKLTQLDCSYTNLTSLDVSTNTALERLSIWSSKLKSIDLSKNHFLSYLVIEGSQLTSLDLTHNPALQTVQCTYSSLKEIDVSKCLVLAALFCYNDQLTYLDVTKNEVLKALDCRNNQLTTLDISQNKLMDADSVSCDDNVTVITK